MNNKLPITADDYVAYFRAEAARLFGAEGHFHELADVDKHSDLFAALKVDLQLPCLVLRPFTDAIAIENDNPITIWEGTFSILYAVDPTDYSSWAVARKVARQQGLRVIGQMRLEQRPLIALTNRKGWLWERGVTLEHKLEGGDEPLLAGVATGYSFDFDWRVPQPLLPD